MLYWNLELSGYFSSKFIKVTFSEDDLNIQMDERFKHLKGKKIVYTLFFECDAANCE